MTEMTFDDFLQHEEEKEKQRRIKRIAEELKPTTKPVVDKKAAQRALRERIFEDAARRYAESCKRVR